MRPPCKVNHSLGRGSRRHEDDDVLGPLIRERLGRRRHQRLVAGGQRRDADSVTIVLDRLVGRLFRGLEERADVDVDPEIGYAVATTLASRS